MTASHTGLVNVARLRDERSVCCLQSAVFSLLRLAPDSDWMAAVINSAQASAQELH